MKGGRKNLKRASMEKHVSLQDGQSIMQVVSLRGSNLIEVMDAHGEKLIALFPAKFQKSMWIKKGSFIVVDESGKEEALGSGNKVACIVSRVLFYEQVCALQKSQEWPAVFKSTTVNESNGTLQVEDLKGSLHGNASHQGEDETDSSDDNGLPPLEANTNRMKPVELQSDPESDSGSDTDS